MATGTIQQQYNDIIAANYDNDVQHVASRTMDVAMRQLDWHLNLSPDLPLLKVLDIGMGTGLFFEHWRSQERREIVPFGLDISESMVEIAQTRIPDLNVAVDDATNLDDHFEEERFDLICTHFVTGFVPVDRLAPRIFQKLKPGGYWSLVGATTAAFPRLQQLSTSPPLRLLMGGQQANTQDLLTPESHEAVEWCFRQHQFQTAASVLFEPDLYFRDFDSFMEFGYHGGWLTPYIEDIGLHKAGPWIRKILNAAVFPVDDQHRIAVSLAQRPESS